jgi:hypothetical protein
MNEKIEVGDTVIGTNENLGYIQYGVVESVPCGCKLTYVVICDNGLSWGFYPNEIKLIKNPCK